MWSSVKRSFVVDQPQPSNMNTHALNVGEHTVISDNTNTVRKTKRRFTNRFFLILQVIGVVCLIPLINYCMKYGALGRITSGYDSCRNICGEENNMDDAVKKSWCDGLDMTYRRYLLVFKPDGRHHYNATRLNQRHNDVAVPRTLQGNVQRVCLVNCSIYQHYYQYKNRCILEKSSTVADIFWGKSGIPNFYLEVAEDIVTYWPEMVSLCVISLVISLIITILFRFLIKMAIWLVLLGLILACFISTIYTWVMWKQWKKIIAQPEYLVAELELRRCQSYLVFAIVNMLLTICAFTVMLIVKSRIEFIVQLFKETGKSIAAIPLMLLQPLVTVVFVGTVVATCVYSFLWIETSGHEVELYDDFYEYQKDHWIYFTRWYNIFVALWSIEFLIGCQHTITAGAVLVWYYANDKNVLGSPVFYGLYNLLRYHIGSISCGSFAILIAQILNGCFNTLKTYFNLQRSFSCCFYIFEAFLKNLTRYAYIEIALYGDPFYTAGINANAALKRNAFTVGAIDSMNHFVLFLGKVFISIVITFAATVLFQEKEDLQHAWVLIIFSGCFAYLVCHCFLSIFEMVIDATFLCFCENCKDNDDTSKSYSSLDLNFIMNFKSSDNVLHVKDDTDCIHRNCTYCNNFNRNDKNVK